MGHRPFVELLPYGDDKLNRANGLVGRGELETVLGKYTEAGSDLMTASDLFHDSGDPLGEAIGWEATAELDRKLGADRDPVARDYYRKAREFYHSHSDRLGEASILLELGRLETTSADDASTDYDTASHIYEDERIPIGQADVLSARGDRARKHKKYMESESYYNKATEIYEKEPRDVCEVRKANVLLGLGDLDRAKNHLNDARQEYEQARLLYEVQLSLIGQANVDFSEGMLPGNPAKPGKALHYLRKARDLYLRIGKLDKVREVKQQLNRSRGAVGSPE